MALTDKNIVITPATNTSGQPSIKFSGGSSTTATTTITFKVLDSGPISVEGSFGQLMSIVDSNTGTIFSVNDISGIPSIEILDSGLVKLAQYGGTVWVSSTTNTATVALAVGGTLSIYSSLENYTSPSISSNAVTLNIANGNVFSLASNAANITANYTNVSTATGQVISTSLIITQGSTAYIPSTCTVNTYLQTIKWQGGTPPTGNANKVDIVSFTFICTGSTTTSVLGSLSTYG